MFMRKKHYQKAGDEITGGKKRPPLQVELVLNSKKKENCCIRYYALAS